MSIGFISILISLIISYFISKSLKKSFVNYRKSITKKRDQLEVLNETLEQKVKKRTKELQKSKEALEVLATTDSLTKINNRYSIMKILDNEIIRIQRYKHPLCVLLYDVDKFKDVNDTYGHDIGDVVLFEMTNVVKSCLRDIDNIGRYGGEEFIIIFPNTSLEDAKIVSERIRKNVEKYIFDKVNKITISLGLVEYKEGENSDKLFKRLDELLYKSKDNGRNQLSF